MLFVDYNSSIRDIFKQVEGVSQHGLEELFDDEVIAGRRSYADAIIAAGLASKEDILNLVAEYLGYEIQIGEVAEIEPDVVSSIQPEIARQYGIVPIYLSEGGVHFLAADPFNSAIIDDLTFALNLEIQLIVCDPDHIQQLLDSYYPQDDLDRLMIY